MQVPPTSSNSSLCSFVSLSREALPSGLGCESETGSQGASSFITGCRGQGMGIAVQGMMLRRVSLGLKSSLGAGGGEPGAPAKGLGLPAASIREPRDLISEVTSPLSRLLDMAAPGWPAHGLLDPVCPGPSWAHSCAGLFPPSSREQPAS